MRLQKNMINSNLVIMPQNGDVLVLLDKPKLLFELNVKPFTHGFLF